MAWHDSSSSRRTAPASAVNAATAATKYGPKPAVFTLIVSTTSHVCFCHNSLPPPAGGTCQRSKHTSACPCISITQQGQQQQAHGCRCCANPKRSMKCDSYLIVHAFAAFQLAPAFCRWYLPAQQTHVSLPLHFEYAAGPSAAGAWLPLLRQSPHQV
jgi:hypothetical protein